ncbi:hypothetical protein [Cupriavidus sp. H18C2]|uniref:hypothetical protein n=1 Tax=Cupriavidus sp. H18C2 TaxID=3241602 RepID=UPI003BF7A581
MTDKEMNLRAAIYTLTDYDGSMPSNAASFEPLTNENDFFLMLAVGQITFERENENTIAAYDMSRRREESIIDGDVTGVARRAAMKVAVDCVIEEGYARCFARACFRWKVPAPTLWRTTCCILQRQGGATKQ